MQLATSRVKNTIDPTPGEKHGLTATLRNSVHVMTRDRLRKIRELFESVVDHTRGQRSLILLEARRDDPGLASEVKKLIFAHEKLAGFIEQPAARVGSLLALEDRETSLAGCMVGGFRMLHLVGEGGMGEVWCAQQTSPMNRRVAVKLIKAGMDTREVVARFESERQTLALMEHPAIATVFDAGSTPEGRPYFAMEYVAGVPITTYCDRHKLTIRERLRLFMQVCDGVQHAHQKAVIHRDLKPSNILVIEVDGKPVPKIIDFGVARAMSQGTTMERALTRVGTILGTPGYMSPEQSNAACDDIDTRSDVYSMGVILYELLVGVLPLDLRKLPLDEALRKLRETDVAPPSARLRSDAYDSTICSKRQTEPAKLIRELRGDLDAIALKALEKERARRYGGPSELAGDIGRYLRSEPISARPPSVAYRAGKYVRRHSVAVGTAGLVMMLLAAFGVVESIEVRRMTRARDRADRIASFMIGMFKVSDPSESRGNTITARELLDKASREIGSGLAKDPELQTQMMNAMGSVYEGLGLYSQSETLLNQTLRDRRRIFGSKHLVTAQTMGTLATTLRDEGRFAEAEALDKESLAVRQSALGPDHPETLQAMSNVARDLVKAGLYREAEQLQRRLLEVRRRVLGAEHSSTLSSLDNLGNTLDELGYYDEAEELEREALEIRRRVLGQDHPDTLRSLHHLADTLYGEGRYAEAEKLHREELSDSRRVLGPEHQSTLNGMIALANALDDEGKFSEAESLEREALAAESRVLGAEHPATLIAKNNLAEILVDEGRYEEAVKLHREVLASRIGRLGPQHAHTFYSMSKLAWALLLSGHLDEAEELSRRAREGQVKALGLDSPDTAETTYNLACVAALRGQTAEALSTLRAAIDHGLKGRMVMRIETDRCLDSLRRNAEYVALVSYARRRAAALFHARL